MAKRSDISAQSGTTIIEAALLMAMVALLAVPGVQAVGGTSEQKFLTAAKAFENPCADPRTQPRGGSRGTCRPAH